LPTYSSVISKTHHFKNFIISKTFITLQTYSEVISKNRIISKTHHLITAKISSFQKLSLPWRRIRRSFQKIQIQPGARGLWRQDLLPWAALLATLVVLHI